MEWSELGLFTLAGVSGNAGFMMLAGFIPGPPHPWFAPVTACLVLFSVQMLVLFGLLLGRHETSDDRVEAVD